MWAREVLPTAPAQATLLEPVGQLQAVQAVQAVQAAWQAAPWG